jgi:hypothetical protein
VTGVAGPRAARARDGPVGAARVSTGAKAQAAAYRPKLYKLVKSMDAALQTRAEAEKKVDELLGSPRFAAEELLLDEFVYGQLAEQRGSDGRPYGVAKVKEALKAQLGMSAAVVKALFEA